MSTDFNAERDLREAEALTKALVPYIYETALYGNAGSGFFSNLPSLTVGAVLLRLRRLETLHNTLTFEQQQRLAQVRADHDHTQHEWATHYEGKIIKEALSRLDAMRTFFDECRDNKRACASNYLPEAQRRTIVEELRLAMERHNIHSADVDSKARAVDGKLRGYVAPASFVWSKALESAYAPAQFWWLYHRPPEPS
jgi:hypothetical protein